MLKLRTDLSLSVDAAQGVISIAETEFGPDWLGDPRREIIQRYAVSIIDTKEKMVREALIKLGWTPPPTESPTVLHSRREEDATGA